MSLYGYDVFRYYLDPELRVIHLFTNCSGLKVAKKYGYIKNVVAHSTEDAQRLDDSGRPCHTCWKREVVLAKKDQRRPRPGFMREPAP